MTETIPLDVYEMGQRSERRLSAMAFETIDDILGAGPLKPKEWIIKGIIARGETSAWIAPPGGLKSALMAELSIAVSWGGGWHGYKQRNLWNVVYFALERADLVRRRMRAHIDQWSAENGGAVPVDLPAIAVVPGVVDLMSHACVEKVVATIREAEKVIGGITGLVVFDTFPKTIAAGGGDEDKAKDQGKVFANIQRIKDTLARGGLIGAPHFALVGHTGKDVERGARGSNALYGDVDLLVTISGDSVKTATVVKANDIPEGPLFSFRSKVFEFGKDEDGDPITVNIVDPVDVEVAQSVSPSKWSKGLRLVKDCIDEAMADSGSDYHIANGPTVRAVNVQDARAIHAKRYVSNGDGDRHEAERKAWARNFKAARDAGLIAGEVSGGREWIWYS